MPGLFLLYLAESIIILCLCLKLITFPWPMIYASNTLSASRPIDELLHDDDDDGRMRRWRSLFASSGVEQVQVASPSRSRSRSWSRSRRMQICCNILASLSAHPKGSSPLDYPFVLIYPVIRICIASISMTRNLENNRVYKCN